MCAVSSLLADVDTPKITYLQIHADFLEQSDAYEYRADGHSSNYTANLATNC